MVGCRSRLTSWPFLRSTSSKETLRKRDDAFWGGRTRKKEEELSSPSMDGPSDIFLNSATLALSIGWIIVAHLSLSLPTVVVREIYSQRIPSHYMLKKIYTRQAENKTTRSVARTTPLAVRLHRSTSALVWYLCGCFPMRSPTPCTLFLFFSHCCLSSFFNGNRNCGRVRGATLFTLCIIRNQRNLRGRNSACPAQYLAGDVIKPENNPKWTEEVTRQPISSGRVRVRAKLCMNWTEPNRTEPIRVLICM